MDMPSSSSPMMSTTAILRAIRFADDAPVCVWFLRELLENDYTNSGVRT